MATYAIGDIQGCFDELQQLLALTNFNPEQDTLWFTGDLVNRGPKSLETLRFIKQLGERAITVLGNHDLHLLAVAAAGKKPKKDRSLWPILEAPDRAELLDWLRRQPLLHHDPKLGCLLIHAGLPPQWDLSTAKQCAAEVEAALRGEHHRDFFTHMYGNHPDQWDPNLAGWERLRFTVNCLTRLRYCDPAGRYVMKPKGCPGSQPEGLLPWFEVAERQTREITVLFGHWSTLGFLQQPRLVSLDSGCLWGGALTALRLEDREVFALTCRPAHCRPGKE